MPSDLVNYLPVKRLLTFWQFCICVLSITTKSAHAKCSGTKRGFDVASRFIVKSDKIAEVHICRSVECYSSQYESDIRPAIRFADRLVGDAARLQHELHFCLNACCTYTWQSIPDASLRATCHPSTSKPPSTLAERLAANTLACCWRAPLSLRFATGSFVSSLSLYHFSFTFSLDTRRIFIIYEI